MLQLSDDHLVDPEAICKMYSDEDLILLILFLLQLLVVIVMIAVSVVIVVVIVVVVAVVSFFLSQDSKFAHST